MKKSKKSSELSERQVTKTQSEKHARNFFKLFATLSSIYLEEELERYKDYNFVFHGVDDSESKGQVLTE